MFKLITRELAINRLPDERGARQAFYLVAIETTASQGDWRCYSQPLTPDSGIGCGVAFGAALAPDTHDREQQHHGGQAPDAHRDRAGPQDLQCTIGNRQRTTQVLLHQPAQDEPQQDRR